MFDFLKKNQKGSVQSFIDGLKIHPKYKAQVKSAFYSLSLNDYDSREAKDLDLAVINNALISTIEDGKTHKKSLSMIGTPGNAVGYQPGGSFLKKIYPNDFSRYAFLAEAYWACRKARNEIVVETGRDGYVLLADPSVPKKTIKLINQVLEDLGVPKLRISMTDTLRWCGNVVMNNSYNKRGGLLKLNPLLMANVQPRWDTYGYEIIGWDIIYGNGVQKAFIPIEDTDLIKTFNARSNVLGVGAFACLEVDIEAALQASIYNNNLMSKGGLLSVIIGMKDPDSGQIVNTNSLFKKADELSKWLERRFGGIRGAGQLAFIPNIDKVEVLNKVSDMDGAWRYLDQSTASKVALQFGLSPERIGLPKTTQYQNKDMVIETMSLSVDNNQAYYQAEVDDYFTNLVIKDKLGEDRVRIESSGEFSSFSKIAAEIGTLFAQMGTEVMTVDEFRTSICHIKPLGGELGAKFLGDVIRQEMLMQPKGAATASKSLGPARLLLPEYQDYRSQLVRHHYKAIRYY